MSSDQPLFYSDYNHLGNDSGAAEHTCSACANQRPGGSKPSESISLTLCRRLLRFALDAGARRAWLDLSGALAVLRVQDGRGQSFNVEIDGLQRAWLEAIDNWRTTLPSNQRPPVAAICPCSTFSTRQDRACPAGTFRRRAYASAKRHPHHYALRNTISRR